MRKRNNVLLSQCVCQKCQTVLTVPRIHGQMRENGHVKDLWCPTCKQVEHFTEIKYNQFYKNMLGEVIE